MGHVHFFIVRSYKEHCSFSCMIKSILGFSPPSLRSNLYPYMLLGGEAQPKSSVLSNNAVQRQRLLITLAISGCRCCNRRKGVERQDLNSNPCLHAKQKVVSMRFNRQRWLGFNESTSWPAWGSNVDLVILPLKQNPSGHWIQYTCNNECELDI